MDESSRLIAQLQQKLRELDHKVAVYRQDMASEYTKYADGLLRDVPEDVSTNVRKAIAEGIASYPSLAPVSVVPQLGTGYNDASINHQTLLLPDADSNAIQRPPIYHSISEPPPRSPHARDKEFHGVFTPNYLPLLDSRHKEEESIVHSAGIDEIVSNATPAISFTRPQGASVPFPTSSSYTPESPLPKLPVPRRRNTENIPTSSDRSDSPMPRSALRRRSSSLKSHSPRRVRFEFEGKEFETTSSPIPPAPISEAADNGSSLPRDTQLDSDDEVECEMVEDIADVPPPKKVSSTQALRALSRGPIEDDGTKWTSVTAPPDGSASIEGEVKNGEEWDEDVGEKEESDDEDEDEFLAMGSRRKPTNSTGSKGLLSSALGNSNDTTNEIRQNDGLGTTISANGSKAEADEAAEKDDVLAEMSPLKPMRSHRAFSNEIPSSVPAPISTNFKTSQSNATVGANPKGWRATSPSSNDITQRQPQTTSGSLPKTTEEDDEELFGFEDESGSSGGTRPKPYIEQNPTEDEPKDDNLHEDKVVSELSQYSRSPARGIVKRRLSGSDTSGALSHVQSGSFRAGGGSLRGNHPFNTPVVNEAVHAEAARLGPLNSFVGSLSGNSGPDPCDISSYTGIGSFRGTNGLFAGTPVSLTERMMLEDYLESQKGDDNEDDDDLGN